MQFVDQQREYIACQGCLKATMPAFWQMVWEQGSKIISMMTNFNEGGKVGYLSDTYLISPIMCKESYTMARFQ